MKTKQLLRKVFDKLNEKNPDLLTEILDEIDQEEDPSTPNTPDNDNNEYDGLIGLSGEVSWTP